MNKKKESQHVPKAQENNPQKTPDEDQTSDGRDQPISQVIGWKGPLPPPQVLESYDSVVKNGAERVFKQFEKEGRHRREMEQSHLNAQIRDMLIGKIFAFVFVMSVIAMGIFAISQGASIVGGLLAGGALASIVWAFVKVTGEGRRQEPNDYE